MLDQLPRPIIFAHRGASAHAPENTLASFELALRQGADAIELDAKLSKDKQVVVIHDQTVNRTTNGSGQVKSLTLAELRLLDAGSHYDIAYQGELIPTLDEVFKAVGQLTFINIELTNYGSIMDDLPEKVAGLVKKHKISRRVLFSSFNPLALIRIHKFLPEAPIGLLASTGIRGALARSWLGNIIRYQSLHPNYKDITHDLIDRQHKRNRLMFAYTVNHTDDLQQLFRMGIDGVFTDDPLLARQVLTNTHLEKSPP